ncbi:hypothetical protein BD626DRAFT_518918 [Schizophyllum amplum]|uniref:MYND-type domain-containing protein n=1 Tax=Schizophyllum amplum TaxID=97359 RepID=A0A550BVM3_9AGAR|nr:hypothetical protein BD626DRAFT_518918 [Auriculariopsis ampla]
MVTVLPSSVQELACALARLLSAVLAVDPPLEKRSPEIRRLVKEALRYLTTDTLREILLRDPPLRTPLIDFTMTNDALAILFALHAFAGLTNLIYLGYLDLWALPEPQDAVWPHVFQWIGYLLPLNHSLRLSSFPPLSIMPQILDAMLSIFDSLLTLPVERARSVLLSGGHDAIRDMVAIWLYSPALTGNPDIQDLKGNTRRACCSAVLQNLWAVLGGETESRAILVESIMRAVKGRSRRLLRNFSAHIDALTKHLCAETWPYMDQLLCVLIPLTAVPEVHRGGFPRCTVRSAMTVLRIALADYPGLCRPAHDLLCSPCCFDPHALLVALDHGLFATLVEVRAKRACQDSALLGRMSLLISCAFISPRAVQRFQDALPEGFRLTERSYHPDEQALLDLADERFALLQEFNKLWCRIARCANRSCPSSCPDAGLLRACPCGLALYCSRACQRSHWNSGHRTMCALKSVHPEVAPLKPRDVQFLRFLSASYLTANYARAQRTSDGYSMSQPQGDMCEAGSSRV